MREFRFLTIGFLSIFLCSCGNVGNEEVFIGELSKEQKDSIRKENQIKELKVYKLTPKEEYGLESFDSVLLLEEHYFPSGQIKRIVDNWGGAGETIKTYEYYETGVMKYEKNWQAGQTSYARAVTNYEGKQYFVDHSYYEIFYNEAGKEIRSTYNSVTTDQKELKGGFDETEWIADTVNIERDYSSEGKLEKQHKNSFNDRGHKVLVFDMLKNRPKRKTIFKYDENGHIIFQEDQELDPLNHPTRMTFIYEGDKLVERRSFTCYGPSHDCDFEISGRGTYEYDEMGNEIRSINYGKDGETTYLGEYEYDYNDNGLVLERVYLKSGEVQKRYENEYDDHGRIVKTLRTSYGDEQKEHLTSYEYNSIGLMSKLTRKAEGESETIETYIYKKYKNDLGDI